MFQSTLAHCCSVQQLDRRYDIMAVKNLFMDNEIPKYFCYMFNSYTVALQLKELSRKRQKG